MIYLFRKNNKQIALVTGAAAWEMYSSNGDWKYRPIYLGAVTNEAYDAIKEQIQEAVPIDDELIARVNTGKDKRADRELRALNEKRSILEKDLIEKVALKADKSQVPANMDVVNRDTLQPHEQKALSKLIGA